MEATTTITLKLPSSLVEEARKEGLLTDEEMAKTLKTELKRRKLEGFGKFLERIHAIEVPPMPDEEINAEIRAVRCEQQAKNATRP